MKTNKLREKYLEFFEKKKHKVFPSDTLVPDDPTLLFTSAGMNQFKPYFLGEKKDVTRAASCQKCFRTGDLDEVGRTPFHHTFFEMLGNFSFGDYFKKEAIEFAWEFVTGELVMNPDDLWVSVYQEDNEAYNIWKDNIGVPEERIIRLGAKSNFWPSNAPVDGPNGPCGPCSEIFFDRGINKGCARADCNPDCDCGRFVEVWNLVFTQFNRVGENQLEDLPQKNIDTGMGLERMAAVLQGKYSNFEIDIFIPAIEEVKKVLKIKDFNSRTASLVYAIVDHSRAATFSIADGVYPSNEERGYVIRKIIRKSVWAAHLMGHNKPFLYELPDLYATIMGDVYPEIVEKKEVISKVIRAEEEKFLSTLKDAVIQLEDIIGRLKSEGENTVSAEDSFRLYDTFGLPLEVSREVVKDAGMQIDEDGFNSLLKRQQERSRRESMFDESIFKKGEIIFNQATEFVGEQALSADDNIIALFKDNASIEQVNEGEEALLVLGKTPFYAESGGQLSDTGVITTDSGQFIVTYVSKAGDTIVHKGKVKNGTIAKGKATAVVDEERRRALMRAHTATHLLQASLRTILGNHVAQQGSLVDEDKLRFDFTHFQAVTVQELAEVEELVNDCILKGIKVKKDTFSFEDAKKQGALAFFKDKYADKVRVVSIADRSKELCGGTHLDTTSEIGLFMIVSESSISSGIRRIEAVVGEQAYRAFSRIKKDTQAAGYLLKAGHGDLVRSVMKLQDDLKKEKDKVRQFGQKMVSFESAGILKDIKELNGIKYLTAEFKDKDKDALLYLCDLLRKKEKLLFLFLVSRMAGKNMFLCAVTKDVLDKNVSAKGFVSSCGKDLSLKGGGRPNLIQGVVADMPVDFISKAEECIKRFLKSST